MSTTVTVDVREDIRNGGEPFPKIMKAVSVPGPNDQLRLLVPFEPVPLFHVMTKQGFSHHAEKTPNGDWEVLFFHAEGHSRTEESHSQNGTRYSRPAAEGESQIIHLDARGLEPPQPLVKILEALATLSGNTELCARTDRRPMHLFAQLEERGFTGTTEEQSDGSFITHIRR